MNNQMYTTQKAAKPAKQVASCRLLRHYIVFPLRALCPFLQVISLSLLFCPSLSASTQAPAWWTNRAVLNPTNASDYSLLNQGQLKWLATQTANEFSNAVPGFATSGSNILSLVQGFNMATGNYRPVNLGQLKSLAQPFYDYTVSLNLTNQCPFNPTTPYPWSGKPSVSNDFVLANIGQAKYLFSFTDGSADFNSDPDASVWYTLTITSNQWVTPDNEMQVPAWVESNSYNGRIVDGYAQVNLPWLMPIFGSSYSNAYVNIHGRLTFVQPDNIYRNTALPSMNPGTPFLSAFWDDLALIGNSAVTTASMGDIGQRKFVVTWQNVARGDYPDSSLLTFQIVLVESNSSVIFNYLELSGMGASGDEATIGIQASSSNARQYAFNTAGAVTQSMSLVFTPKFQILPWSSDADGDGMPNAWEIEHGLNPYFAGDANQDADGDGLTNLQEYRHGTDPQNSNIGVDSDGDGMSDLWEIQYGLNRFDPSDVATDPDHDGLTNLQEYQTGTDPHNPDTDGDGLNDGGEIALGTDPLNSDTDGDGLSDGLEAKSFVVSWTSPNNITILTNIPGMTDSLLDGRQIAAGASHVLLLKNDGHVVAWGDNTYGQTTVPVCATNTVAVAAGAYHSLALLADGAVVWSGQTSVPGTVTNATSIAAGDCYSIAILADSNVVAWGSGVEMPEDWSVGMPIGLSNVVEVAACVNDSLARLADGHVVAWDYDGNNIDVPGIVSNAVAIAATAYGQFLAKLGNDTVISWYDPGEYPNGAGLDITVPQQLSNVTSIASAHGFPGFMYSTTDNRLHGLGVIPDCPIASRFLSFTATYGTGYAIVCLGTSATNADSDLDGISDGEELASGTNPADSNSCLPAVILQSPSSQRVHSGEMGIFDVTAECSRPLTYQWLRNNQIITGATGRIYTTPATSYTDNGAGFSVVISSDFGSLTSKVASLVLTDTFVISAAATHGQISPAGDCILNLGTSVVFSVTANAGFTLSDVKVDGVSVGAVSNYCFENLTDNHTIIAEFSADGVCGQYWFQFAGGQHYYSNMIDPSINFICAPPLPSAYYPSADYWRPTWTAKILVTNTQDYTFYTVTADGVKLWIDGMLLINDNANHSESTTNTSPAIHLEAGHKYDLRMEYLEKGGAWVAKLFWSSPVLPKQIVPSSALFAETSPVSILEQPSDVTAICGQSAVFSVSATGLAPSSYQWLRNGVPIPYATNSIYTIQAVTIFDLNTGYSVLVSNVFNGVFSRVANLVVNYSIQATADTGGTISPSGSITLAPGSSQSFSISPAPGFGNIEIVVDGTSVGTNSSCSFADISMNHSILARFGQPASITNNPASLVVSIGAQATFNAGSAGYPLVWQWLSNGVPVAGANAATYTTPPLTLAANSSCWSVVAGNILGSVTSAVAVLRVVQSGLDSDGDGISDLWEIQHGLNPLDLTDAGQDPDHDGLTNLKEYQAGTDPFNPESDDDGLTDGQEVKSGLLAAWLPGKFPYYDPDVALDVCIQGGVKLALMKDGHVKGFISEYECLSDDNSFLSAITNAVAISRGHDRILVLKQDGCVEACHIHPEMLTNLVWSEELDGGNWYESLVQAFDWGGRLPTKEELQAKLLSDEILGGYLYWSSTETSPEDAYLVVGHEDGYARGQALEASRYGEYCARAVKNTNVFSCVVAQISNAIAIVEGLALLADGQVVAWGSGEPTPIASNVVAIAASDVSGNGVILFSNGEVGDWSGSESNLALHAFATNATAIAAGSYHNLALLADGTIVAWGGNDAGQCDVPEGLSNMVTVTAAGDRSCSVNASGRVYTWGDNWMTTNDVVVGRIRKMGVPGNSLEDELGGIALMNTDTCPTNSDTDGDGMPDGWEVFRNFDPKNPADANQDADGDGLTNLQEYQVGTDPHNPDSDGDGLGDGIDAHPTVNNSNDDQDHDGLTLADELAAGTDPFNPDSDGDGVNDGVDLWPNTYNQTVNSPQGFDATITMSETREGPNFNDPLGRAVLTIGSNVIRVLSPSGSTTRTLHFPAGQSYPLGLADSRPNDVNGVKIHVALQVSGAGLIGDPGNILSSQGVHFPGTSPVPGMVTGLAVRICYAGSLSEIGDDVSLCIRSNREVAIVAEVTPPGIACELSWTNKTLSWVAPEFRGWNQYDFMGNWGVESVSILMNGQDSGVHAEVVYHYFDRPSDQWAALRGTEGTSTQITSDVWKNVVPYNNDDDNLSGQSDLGETGFDETRDLAEIEFYGRECDWFHDGRFLEGCDFGLGNCDYAWTGMLTGTVSIVSGPAKVWDNCTKSGGVATPLTGPGSRYIEGIGVSTVINDAVIEERCVKGTNIVSLLTNRVTVMRLAVQGDINHDDRINVADLTYAQSAGLTNLIMGCGTNNLTRVELRTDCLLNTGAITLNSGVRLWTVQHPTSTNQMFLDAGGTTNWTGTAISALPVRRILYAEGVTPGPTTIGYSYVPPVQDGPRYSSSLPVTVIKVELVKLWETKNKANQIFNTSIKDDPRGDPATDPASVPDSNGETYGTPRNNLYLVPDPADSKYKATIEADIQPASMRTKIIAAVYTGGTKLAGSDKAFDATGKCNLEFTHSGSDINNFVVQVGFDVNGNNQLDQISNEIMPFVVKNISTGQPVGDPIIRGSSLTSYSNSKIWITGGQFSGLLYPNGADFLSVFCDGNANNVSGDNVPAVSSESFNCFSGVYSEWLTHNSGAAFNDGGTVQSLPHYTWSSARKISQAIADSAMIKDVAKAYYNSTIMQQVITFFAANPSVNEHDFDVAIPHQSLSPTNWAASTVEFHTGGISMDDLGVTIGRGRVTQHRADFFVQRDTDWLGNPVLTVIAWRSYGVMEDLYDFNHDQSGGLGLGQKAAVVQIGHGNGNYGVGREAGVIYRVTVNFDKSYGGF